MTNFSFPCAAYQQALALESITDNHLPKPHVHETAAITYCIHDGPKQSQIALVLSLFPYPYSTASVNLKMAVEEGFV